MFSAPVWQIPVKKCFFRPTSQTLVEQFSRSRRAGLQYISWVFINCASVDLNYGSKLFFTNGNPSMDRTPEVNDLVASHGSRVNWANVV